MSQAQTTTQTTTQTTVESTRGKNTETTEAVSLSTRLGLFFICTVGVTGWLLALLGTDMIVSTGGGGLIGAWYSFLVH